MKFCPYCGKSIIVTDGKTITINKNIYIEKNEHFEKTERFVDEAKIAEEHRKTEEEKTRRIIGIMLWGILAFMGFIGVILMILEEFGLV